MYFIVLETFNSCVTDPHLYIQRAKILSFLGDFSEAITNYQKALVIARQINHPDTLQLVRRIAHVMMFQGRVWLEQGQMESAIYHFEQGIAVDRTNGMLLIYLALAHFNNKDFTKALARLTEYIEHVAGNNPFPFVLILRCRIYLLMDQIELAHKDFARAKAIDPTVALLKRIESHFMRRGNSLFHEATVHLISLRYEQALKLLNTSIVIDPNDPKRYMLRATTHRQLEKFENALEDLKEASLRTPANERSEIIKQTALTFNDIALKHQSLGNTEQAIAYINQAAILDPKVPGFFINRGDFHRSLDPPRLAHALADYQKANELSRDDPQIMFRISLIHHAFGLQLFNKRDYFSSETEFSLAIQHWTQVAMYYVNRGNCYFYTQNYTLALADFRAALKLDPDNVEARAKVEALAGNFPDKPQTRSNAPGLSNINYFLNDDVILSDFLYIFLFLFVFSSLFFSGHHQEAAAHAAWLASCNFGDSRVPIDVDAVEADRLELLKLRLQFVSVFLHKIRIRLSHSQNK
jgi:tetratricopeptide (TPR) repeat protein